MLTECVNADILHSIFLQYRNEWKGGIITNREEALNFLHKIAEGISLTFGRECEVVIHEMYGKQFTNVAVYNGHVSGRTEGSTLSIFGNDTSVDEDDNARILEDYINQLVTLPSGNIVKSSTFHMRGDGYHFALGINYDMTILSQMKHVLNHLTQIEGDLYTSLSIDRETSIEVLFQSCVEMVNKPIEKMKKADRLTLVKLLKDKGAFNVQKSVPYVAEQLGVSKYTVYNYLNEIGESV